MATRTAPPTLPACSQHRCKLRTPIERVRALAHLDFYKFGDDRAAFGLGEPADKLVLRLNAEPDRPCDCSDTRMYETSIFIVQSPSV